MQLTVRRISAAAATLVVAAAVGLAGNTAVATSHARAVASAVSKDVLAGDGHYTAAQIASATKLGIKVGKADGPKVKLPMEKVGVLQYIGSVEPAQRGEAALDQAIHALHWTIVRCDGQGDPVKVGQCGDTLLNEGAKVLFVNAVEPSLYTEVLQRAKQMKVPVFNYAGAVSPSPLFAGSYVPNDTALGALEAKYLIAQLETQPGTKEIAVHEFPAGFAQDRTNALLAALKNYPDIKIVATPTTDGTNPVGSTQTQVAAELTQYPNLSAIWVAYDFAVAGAATTLQTQDAGKTFPNRPLLVSFSANQSTIALMHEKYVDSVADDPFELTGWTAVDQAAEYFARHRTPSQSPRPNYPINYLSPVLVTQKNVPPLGRYLQAKDDAQAFFRAKWMQEFGL
jgi:ABC-type sugar transport system substrate-binding protein